MLTNLESHSPSAAQSFYQTYFTDILMQIFSVVTDTSHTAGLAQHAQILAYMFTLVETNKITVNLGPIPDNTLFVQEYVASLLKSAFSHLTDNQIKVFVTGLFNLNQEVSAFKEHLRDFLIQIRVSTAFRRPSSTISKTTNSEFGSHLSSNLLISYHYRRSPAMTIRTCIWPNVKRNSRMHKCQRECIK